MRACTEKSEYINIVNALVVIYKKQICKLKKLNHEIRFTQTNKKKRKQNEQKRQKTLGATHIIKLSHKVKRREWKNETQRMRGRERAANRLEENRRKCCLLKTIH